MPTDEEFQALSRKYEALAHKVTLSEDARAVEALQYK